MRAVARIGGPRLFLCAAALLACPAGAALAQNIDLTAEQNRGIEDRNGTNGVFTTHITQDGLKVSKIQASFRQAFFSTGAFVLRDWHVKIEFFDMEGKPYGHPVTQKNNPGPDNKGSFVWDAPKGFKAREGEIHVSLFEKRGTEMKRIGLVEYRMRD